MNPTSINTRRSLVDDPTSPGGWIIRTTFSGAGMMFLIGALAGAITGPILPLVDKRPERLASVLLPGVIIGGGIAAIVGFISGAIIHLIVGVMTRHSLDRDYIFDRAMKMGALGSLAGVAVGGFAGAKLLVSYFHGAAPGFFFGVVGGFILGTAITAIWTARRELVFEEYEVRGTEYDDE